MKNIVIIASFVLLSLTAVHAAELPMVQFSVDTTGLKLPTIISFVYDTSAATGPGAVVYMPRAEHAIYPFGMNLPGNAITVTHVNVQYGTFKTQSYSIDSTCENMPLQDLSSSESKHVWFNFIVDPANKFISCKSSY